MVQPLSFVQRIVAEAQVVEDEAEEQAEENEICD